MYIYIYIYVYTYIYTHMHICIYISKVKLATIVEGDPKAPFLIAYYTKV